MAEEKQENPVVGFDEAMSEKTDDFVRVAVHSKRREATGWVVFKKLGGNVLREFRKLNGGNGNPKKARPLAANNYLLDEVYVGVENLAIPFEAEGSKDEKTFFQQHSRGRLFIDIVLGTYLGMEIPDTDEGKQ